LTISQPTNGSPVVPRRISSAIPSWWQDPPGEPFTFPLGTDLATKVARLNEAADSSLSIYAHGCVRYHDVMTNLERVTEFCVRSHGGDNYQMCNNSNLME
jgi:hypothetical protein